MWVCVCVYVRDLLPAHEIATTGGVWKEAKEAQRAGRVQIPILASASPSLLPKTGAAVGGKRWRESGIRTESTLWSRPEVNRCACVCASAYRRWDRTERVNGVEQRRDVAWTQSGFAVEWGVVVVIVIWLWVKRLNGVAHSAFWVLWDRQRW